MINYIQYSALDEGDGRVLLIMLPGVGIETSEFAAHGMVAAVHALGQNVDIIAARPDLEHYLDGDIARALHGSIIEPALAKGYQRIWLLGISLGGMGALLYAAAYPGQVEGLVLLAPFLGTQGTIAEITKAGGLASWSPAQTAATATEHIMLAWLQNFLSQQPGAPLLYLGYGLADRFAPGHRLLADELPENKVVTIAGGHDWNTWLALWKQLLAVLPGRCAARQIGWRNKHG